MGHCMMASVEEDAVQEHCTTMAMIQTALPLPEKEIQAFCDRWQIIEFALFGSILRDDFRPDSDIDVLVTFLPEAHHNLFDLVHMANELKAIFHREVDLVSRRGLERSLNYLRRNEILSSAQVIYAA